MSAPDTARQTVEAHAKRMRHHSVGEYQVADLLDALLERAESAELRAAFGETKREKHLSGCVNSAIDRAERAEAAARALTEAWARLDEARYPGRTMGEPTSQETVRRAAEAEMEMERVVREVRAWLAAPAAGEEREG